jgi:peptidoglycan/LPS O-acetylase OafA/YrhL
MIASGLTGSIPPTQQEVADLRPVARRQTEFANLDVLRAIAVLCVYVCHLPLGIPSFGFISPHQLGIGGVLFFFVHTSLVLLMSLERTKTRMIFRDFYVRRAFRIYPLSILCVLVCTTFSVQGRGWMGTNAFVSNLLLVQNITRTPDAIGPLWSLPWEVQMYLVLPAVYLVLRRSNAPLRASVSVWLASLLLACCSVLSPLLVLLHAAAYPPFFFGGVVAYIAMRRARPSLPAAMWPPAICALIVLRGVALGTSDDFYSLRHLIVNASVCLLLGSLIPQFADLPRSVLTRAGHLIAKYSYGIYLFHVPVIWLAFVKLSHIHIALRVGVLLSLSVVVPAATYHLLEDPMIRAGKSIAARWRDRGRSPALSKASEG